MSHLTQPAAPHSVKPVKLPALREDILTIVSFTLLYVPYVAHAAVTRPFWLDELFTFYIVTMPDWAGMMDLIQRGPDQNPPLFYALTRFIVSILGESEWAFRLPAMVGYWVFCVTLYAWIRLLGGARAAALAALVTPVLTAAVYYASEARPYGLALGWLGIGLLGWQLTRHPSWQAVGIVGLSTGLSIALALHYLIILPVCLLWAIEGLLAWRQRQLDGRRWIAMFSPLIVLALHSSFLYQQGQQRFWKISLEWKELADFYWWLLGSPAYLGLCAVVGLLTWSSLRRRTIHNRNADVWLISGVGFLCLPLLWMTFLKVTHQAMFQERYLLPTLVGLGGLTAYGLRHLPEHQTRLTTLAIWCLLGIPVSGAAMQPWRLSPPSVAEVMDLPNPDYPVVAAAHLYFPIRYYYPGQFSQLVYVDPKKREPPSVATGIWALQRHPDAPIWLDNDEFFSLWEGNFYFTCHKTYMKHWIGEFERRGYPIVRETPGYIVYEWQRKRM